MSVEEINSCRICGNKDLIPIIDLGHHALSAIFPAKHEPDPLEVPLILVKCNDEKNSQACGLLQLKHTVPGDTMYLNHYGYRSGINKTMTHHLKSIVDQLNSKIKLASGDVVLDIGSNDATLLKYYDIPGLKRIGIDPTGDQFKEYYPKDILLLSDFFTSENFKKLSPDKRAKAITSIAMFYDLKEPMRFVKDVKDSLSRDGIWVFEQSYMPTMLELNSFDTICHEHLEYYTLKQIQWMMQRSDLRILDVGFNDANGGSFRTIVGHADSPFKDNTDKIRSILIKEKESGLETQKPYKEFRERVESIRNQIKKFINTYIL